MNERQRTTLNRFLDGHESKNTTKNWAQMNHCSKDTAIRDIQDLVAKQVLREDISEAKRPSYSIIYEGDDLANYNRADALSSAMSPLLGLPANYENAIAENSF